MFICCLWLCFSPRIRVGFILILRFSSMYSPTGALAYRNFWQLTVTPGCLVRAQQGKHSHTHPHALTHTHRSRRRANCTLNKPACHNNDENRLHYVLLSLFLWFTAVKATHAWDGLQGCCQGEFNVLGFSVFLGACHIGSALTGIPAGTSGIVNINRILIPPKHCGGILISFPPISPQDPPSFFPLPSLYAFAHPFFLNLIKPDTSNVMQSLINLCFYYPYFSLNWLFIKQKIQVCLMQFNYQQFLYCLYL